VVRAGGFVIGDYTGRHEVADGRRLAASLAGLPLYGTEVRMWIAWPSDPAERDRLDRNLRKFAETTGAVVWAPDPDATTDVLESCRDLGAIGRDGSPSAWRCYAPSPAGSPRFVSDADGRLSPAGELLTVSTDGVPLISVEPVRWRSATDRYTALRPSDGLFVTDLTVLPDGRWAVQYAGSGPHVAGPRELELVLRSVGWRGEDLMLLATYPATAAAGLHRYGRRLSDELEADIWVLPPDATFTVADGAPRAVDEQGRPSEWECLTSGGRGRRRSVEGFLVPAPAAPDDRAGPDRFLASTSRDDWEEATATRAPLDPPAEDVVREGTDTQAAQAPSQPSGPLPPTATTPRLHPARSRLKHGIYWLADRPRVNADPIDLYVIAPASPDRVVEDGLPTPQLFAVGLLRPPAAESLQPGESLIRVRVGEAGAVDLSSIDVHVPPTLQLLLNARESYLLPGGLLERTRVVEGYVAEPGGGYRPAIAFDDRPALRLRCSGARHGVEGLPADVPRWPRAADSTAYALLPGPHVAAEGGALPILAGRPRVRAGHRLLRLRVPRRRAIDVQAAAAQLEPLTSVRSAAAALTGKGIELIVQGRDFDKVTVLQVLTPGKLSWQAVDGLGGVSLADFLAANG